MPYEIERGESLEAGVRRTAREEADGALESLTELHDADPAEAIHDARKRFKKIRAVLRLVRMRLGPDAYGTANVAWRDAGRVLAGAREATAAVETVDGLVDADAAELDDGGLQGLRERLVERRDARLAGAVATGGPVDEVVERVAEARARIASWPLEGLHIDVALEGTRKVYRRGRERMADAYEAMTGEAFHEWRKRVKYLWYHLRLLGPAWPEVIESLAEVQHDLSDVLGDGNDLTDLLELLAEEPRLVGDGAARGAVEGVARRRRAWLWERARPLGARLYASEPDDFVERLRSYWTAMEMEERLTS